MLIAVARLSDAGAQVTLRERLTYTAETRAAALIELRTFCAEAVVLDTCNRSELYVALGDGEGKPYADALRELFGMEEGRAD